MCRSSKENHVSVQAVDYIDLKRKDFEIMRYSTLRKIKFETKFKLSLLKFKLSLLKFEINIKLLRLKLRTKFRLCLLELKLMCLHFRLRFFKPKVSVPTIDTD